MKVARAFRRGLWRGFISTFPYAFYKGFRDGFRRERDKGKMS